MNRELILNAIKSVNSKTELAIKLGFKYLNGRTSKEIDNLLAINDIALPNFDKHIKQRKYKVVEKCCPICDNKFVTKIGHRDEKTVCSIGCSNKYFIRHTEESKEKISKALIEYNLNSSKHKENAVQFKNCLTCKSEFLLKHKNQKYCTRQCANKIVNRRIVNEETRSKLRKAQLLRISEGKHTGWKSRSKCARSWAEQYVENNILSNLGYKKDIDYKTDYFQGKWFIDFAFLNNKIALEIDGKQHELAERKMKDIEKDAWLVKNGWTVYRIKWKKISEQTGKELFNKISSILLDAV